MNPSIISINKMKLKRGIATQLLKLLIVSLIIMQITLIIFSAKSLLDLLQAVMDLQITGGLHLKEQTE